MFMEVHVSDTSPGEMMLSMIFKFFAISTRVTGMIRDTTRSYSLMACVSCPWNVLNFCSCISTILAEAGICMSMRMRARASLMSWRISMSKLTYSLPSDRTRRVAFRPLFMLSTECLHALSHTFSNSIRARAILL
eukprot:gene16731-biopygen16867